MHMYSMYHMTEFGTEDKKINEVKGNYKAIKVNVLLKITNSNKS